MYMEKNGDRLKSIPDFLPHEMFKNPNSDCLTEQAARGWVSHMILVRRWRVLSFLSLIYVYLWCQARICLLCEDQKSLQSGIARAKLLSLGVKIKFF